MRAVVLGVKALRKCDAEEVTEVTVVTDYQELVGFHRLLASPKAISRKKLNKKKRHGVWKWYYSNLCTIKGLYRRLDKELLITVKWVKGHNGDAWNEEVDRLAGLKISKSY